MRIEGLERGLFAVGVQPQVARNGQRARAVGRRVATMAVTPLARKICNTSANGYALVASSL